MPLNDHWNHVYTTKESTAVSWFQQTPDSSLKLLETAGLTGDPSLIDVGGGDARLVDALLDRGMDRVTVLDISAAAIARARARLGTRAGRVNWIVADVTTDWTSPPVDLWHDRAVFHFLVDAADRARYVANLRRTLKPGGHAVIATFAPDGPTKCSGLPVMRYSPESLKSEVGPGFELVQAFVQPHETPMGTTQSFVYTLFRADR